MVLSEDDNGSPALFWHALSTESSLTTTRQNKGDDAEASKQRETRRGARALCMQRNANNHDNQTQREAPLLPTV